MLVPLGIDISKKTFDVALLKENGKFRHKKFSNNSKGFGQLKDWLQDQGVSKTHACMEATSTYYFELASFLYKAGHRVSVINPAKIKAYAQSELSRNKTDKLDASLIARFCLRQAPEPWNPPPKEFLELQALVRRLENLQAMEVQEKNRLSQSPPEIIQESLKEHIESLEGQIRIIKKIIRDHIDQNPNLKNQKDLLMTIPGIAETTAVNLLSEIQNFKAFSNARQLAAFAGLTPRQHSSGTSIKKWSGLSKTGNSKLRKYLYFPAIVAKNHNPILKKFCNNLKERGKTNMVIIGAAMRKLLHIIYGVLKSGRPFEPNLA